MKILKRKEALFIPVAESTPAALLKTADSQPVWPLASPEDYEALKRFALAFNLRLKAVKAEETALTGGIGTVVGLGSQTFGIAKLYAHLTGRSLQCVRTRRELDPIESIDVILVLQEDVDTVLLHDLYERSGPACGLLVADSASKLRVQCLIRAAAVRYVSPVQLPRVEIFPSLPFAVMAREDRISFGNLAQKDQLEPPLSKASELLLLSTHSDGMDTQLVGQLVLCANAGKDTAGPIVSGPACASTGECYRLKEPVKKLRARSQLISPNKIVTRFFLYHTCYGLFVSERLHHYEWDLSTALLNSSTIGAVVTSWKLIRAHPLGFVKLADELQSGVPLGVAIGRLNRRESKRRTGGVFCILGDPAMRVSNKRRVKMTMSQPRQPSRAGIDLLYLGFLRQLLESSEGQEQEPDVVAGGIEALTALTALEKALWRGSTTPVMLQSFQKALFEFLLARTSVIDKCLQMAQSSTTTKGGPCWICRTETDRLTIRIRNLPNHSRHVTICPRCGITSNSPIGSEVHARLHNTRVISQGFLPTSNWKGSVQISARWPLQTHTVEWPARLNNVPRKNFSISCQKEPGVIAFRCLFMWDFNFAFCGHDFRWD